MSRFKNKERVQIIATGSTYRFQYGTVVNTDTASVHIIVDGKGGGTMRFWDTELVPAPNATVPAKELARTQSYLRELEEDAKLMTDAAGLYPQGTSTQKDLQAFAGHQVKIVYNLKMLLSQDGVTLWEAEDGTE